MSQIQPTPESADAPVDRPEPDPTPWIGVDLDGTLAKFQSWRGIGHVGKPIPDMMERVRRWRSEGIKVKIFTARAQYEDYLPPIRKWLKKQKLEDMEITNELDPYVLEIWDDRAIQVISNTGQIYRHPSVTARPKAPLLEEAFPHENRPTLSFM
ncbi:hypothetical protein [Cerasicoccus maritimus]|uniref:hypothetical protein n=1 Tax=Cerasicoccus maritimus TaxID=490089 RepID=UPI0028527DC3|nr:hypothetical protein [Cerasicoccus maritimus]